MGLLDKLKNTITDSIKDVMGDATKKGANIVSETTSIEEPKEKSKSSTPKSTTKKSVSDTTKKVANIVSETTGIKELKEKPKSSTPKSTTKKAKEEKSNSNFLVGTMWCSMMNDGEYYYDSPVTIKFISEDEVVMICPDGNDLEVSILGFDFNLVSFDLVRYGSGWAVKFKYKLISPNKIKFIIDKEVLDSEMKLGELTCSEGSWIHGNADKKQFDYCLIEDNKIKTLHQIEWGSEYGLVKNIKDMKFWRQD